MSGGPDEKTQGKAGRRAADRRREREEDDPDNDETRLGLGARDHDHTPAPRQRARPTRSSSGEGLATGFSQEGEVERTSPGELAPPPLPGGAFVELENQRQAVFLVDRSPCLIGRGTRASFQLGDDTVSRLHALLSYVAEDEMWVLEDLNSTSGTTLNGVVLERPVAIMHGDIVAFGQLELRFLGREQVPEEVDEHTATEINHTAITAMHRGDPTKVGPRPGANAGGNRGLVVAVLIALLLIVGTSAAGGYWAWTHRGDPAHLEAQTTQLLDEAKQLLEARRFDEAQQRLDTVAALDPENRRWRSLSRTLAGEREAQAALKKARRLFADGEIEACRFELQKIADSSMFAPEKLALLKTIIDRDRDRELNAIEALIDAGELDKAEARLASYRRIYPKDERAAKLAARIEGIRNYVAPENADVVRAKAAFDVGNHEQAGIIAGEAAAKGVEDARAYVGRLATFEARWRRGQQALSKKRPADAVEHLELAYGMVPELGGGRSGAMRRKVARDLADALYLQSVERRRADRCAAAAALWRASSLDASDPKITAAARRQEGDALAALDRARAKVGSDPDAAKRMAEQALCLAQPSSKVQRDLKALAGR